MYKANTEVVICLCVNQEKKDKNENCKLLWMIRNSETGKTINHDFKTRKAAREWCRSRGYIERGMNYDR